MAAFHLDRKRKVEELVEAGKQPEHMLRDRDTVQVGSLRWRRLLPAGNGARRLPLRQLAMPVHLFPRDASQKSRVLVTNCTWLH